jgi:transposase
MMAQDGSRCLPTRRLLRLLPLAECAETGGVLQLAVVDADSEGLIEGHVRQRPSRRRAIRLGYSALESNGDRGGLDVVTSRASCPCHERISDVPCPCRIEQVSGEGNEETALQYKQLWMVEKMFRTVKTLLETRPIFHKCDETIRGDVFCSILALLLRRELQDGLESQGEKLE